MRTGHVLHDGSWAVILLCPEAQLTGLFGWNIRCFQKLNTTFGCPPKSLTNVYPLSICMNVFYPRPNVARSGGDILLNIRKV